MLRARGLRLRRWSVVAARCASSVPSSVDESNWRTKVFPALKTFRQEFGHCIVEEEFKVPDSLPWPQAAWGLPLGLVVRSIREGGSYVDQAARYRCHLDVLHFPWDHQAAVWKDRILPALEAYAGECGHCRVPFMFVVPSREPWLKSAWGMHLGTMVASMRGMGSYFAFVGRDVERLNELGYSLELSARVWKKYAAPLTDTFATCFGEHTAVPDDFVVPSELPWPEEMWGVWLGTLVARNTRHLCKM